MKNKMMLTENQVKYATKKQVDKMRLIHQERGEPHYRETGSSDASLNSCSLLNMLLPLSTLTFL